MYSNLSHRLLEYFLLQEAQEMILKEAFALDAMKQINGIVVMYVVIIWTISRVIVL